MGEIISIANQKGGVGKTTTTLSLGVALAKQGKKVLLIDADPQGNLTTCLGYEKQEEIPITLAYLMQAEISDMDININDAIIHNKENVDLIPSDIDLSALELSLNNAMSREFILKNVLSNVKEKYDYVLIDCMPSLGLIPINCLATSDEIIIPVQSQYLAAKGMTYLFDTIRKVNKTINPDLRVKGILLTLVDKRTNLAKDIRSELDNTYGKYVKIYDTEIPLAIKTAEASIQGKSIFEYDKNNSVAKAYEKFAEEVLHDERQQVKNKFAINR
jgi:chromosome partitioning protein